MKATAVHRNRPAQRASKLAGVPVSKSFWGGVGACFAAIAFCSVIWAGETTKSPFELLPQIVPFVRVQVPTPEEFARGIRPGHPRLLLTPAREEEIRRLLSTSATARGWYGTIKANAAYYARQPFVRTYPRLLVYETGVHFLDTFRFLGGKIASVYARLQWRNSAIAGDDAGQIICGFSSGATAVLDASRYNEADTADARYTFGTVRIDGRQGHLELDLEGNLSFKPLGQPSRRIEYSPSRVGFAGDCVHAFQRHFVDRMIDGQPFESTGDDYLETVALVEACYRSHTSRQVVSPSNFQP